MSADQENPRRPVRSRIGSLTTTVLVFAFATVVVLAILMGAFFVALGVVALAIPTALIAKLALARRRAGHGERIDN